MALDAAGQALVATAELANLVIFNNGSLEDLHGELEELIERLP